MAKHGIDFADAEPVLYDPCAFTTTRTCETARGPEIRHITTGTDALGRIITVVWTRRGRNHRLISARHARTEERNHYDQP